MSDSELNETVDSRDETEDAEQSESSELETLTRADDWNEEAFRDAGDATFGGANKVEEIKPGMYAEDLSKEERREEYTLTDEDVAEIRARIRGKTNAENDDG